MSATSATPDQSSFLFGSNATFIAELYARYLKDPQSVDSSWNSFFTELNDDAREVLDELRGASWAPNTTSVIGEEPAAKANGAAAPAAAKANGHAALNGATAPAAAALDQDQLRAATLDSLRALMLIRVYRVRGHLQATLDPLGLEKREQHPELDPRSYGFTDADFDRPIFINNVLGMETATLRQILEVLRKTYCGTIGVEFMHIQDPDQKAWIQERIEGGRNHTDFTVNGKKAILERLTAAENFERFLDKKYTGTKRFGLDGGEALMPAMEQVLKRGTQLGLKEVVLGMPHRGRLNVLANIMGKPFKAIFSEFQGNSAHPEDVQGSGDVKYHLGSSADRDFDGAAVHLSLSPNPSHLEAVDPVVIGRVRAKQIQRSGTVRRPRRAATRCRHPDARRRRLRRPGSRGRDAEPVASCTATAPAARSTSSSTTRSASRRSPSDARSSPYCTDVAKMIQAPIFHVNGDDPEAVVYVAALAIEFRQKFDQDVVIDMFCYRRHGHNEGDEPAFTQPLMYKADPQPSDASAKLYAQQLIAENVITPAEAETIAETSSRSWKTTSRSPASYKPEPRRLARRHVVRPGSGLGRRPPRRDRRQHARLLREVGQAISTDARSASRSTRKIARSSRPRRKAIETGEGIDWATAEALAFGSLCAEGTPVRLSRPGQRPRHLPPAPRGAGRPGDRRALHPAQQHPRRPGDVRGLRQPAVRGGRARASTTATRSPSRTMLILWEAQFGDFANGAQVIIDQFISSGESKWLRMSAAW